MLAAGLVVLSCPSAYAINWQSDTGAWSLSWDTTIGYGQGWRVSGLDCRLIAIANGGCGYSPNIDDGDLNFPKKAAFSEAVKGVTELSLNFRDKMGLFVRADGLYDFEMAVFGLAVLVCATRFDDPVGIVRNGWIVGNILPGESIVAVEMLAHLVPALEPFLTRR